MADTKISALTELAQGGIATDDVFALVDTSATATKKYAWSSLREDAALFYDTSTRTLTNKTLTTPTIGSFANSTHNHQNAAGGGTLDHGLAITGLTDDDHTQYSLLAGRAGGQVLIGGTASGEDLTLQSTSNVTRGSVFIDALDLSPLSNDLGSLGTTSLKWADLFLASGSVINWNSGDLTLTHAANLLTLAGGDLSISGALTVTGTTTLAVALTGVLRADSGVVSTDSDVTDLVSAASDTLAGKVELATAAETTTGTDATRAVTPDGLAGSDYGKRVVGIQVVDSATDMATGDGKAFFRIPSVMNGWNLVGVAARVYTAGTTSTCTIQIRNITQAADMLTTKISIDSAELDSSTAATPAVIDTANDDVATGDGIAIDVDTVHTTAAKGLFVELIFQLP